MEMVSRFLPLAFLCLSLSAYADNPDLKDYLPGQLISVEQYLKLTNQFFNAWEKGEKFESAMQAANDAVEPEALLAGMKLLASPERRTTYAQFTPNYNPEPGHEIASHDGLLGFRVVRQAYVKVKGKRRLLSSIQTYDWDAKLKKMVPIPGADSFRVRAQIDKFVPSGSAGPAKGFVGFSWVVHVGKGGALTKLEARNNVTDDKKRWISEGHAGLYDPRATPCSWTTHCNVCHHADRPNAVSNFGVAPLEKKGTTQFLKYLTEQRKLDGEDIVDVEKVLADPETAFPIDDLQKALLARWLDSKKRE